MSCCSSSSGKMSCKTCLMQGTARDARDPGDVRNQRDPGGDCSDMFVEKIEKGEFFRPAPTD